MMLGHPALSYAPRSSLSDGLQQRIERLLPLVQFNEKAKTAV